MVRETLAALALAGMCGVALADTLVVPSEDFPTIQSAIDAAGPGDTVVVNGGTFVESLSITGRTDLRILGKGGPVLDPADGNGIDIEDCNGVEIVGLTVQGVNNGIWIYDSSDVVLRKVILQDVAYEALGLRNGAGILLTRCIVRQVGGTGLDEQGSTGLVVDHCIFEDCDGGAVSLSPDQPNGSATPGARITRNIFSGGTSGVLAGGADIVIERNRFEGVGGVAVSFQTIAGSDGASVSRNLVSVTGTDRAFVLNGAGIVCAKNALTDGGIIGNSPLQRFEKNSVTGNDFGIAVNGPQAIVRSNRLWALAGNGLDLTSTGHTVEKNVISGCGNAAIYSSAADSEILKNRIADAPWGIMLAGAGNYLAGNRVTGTTTLDLWDQEVGGTNEYGSNAFRTTQFGTGD